MDRQYSTLELVKYDDTARAPERDWDATALELDASVLAPQTVPETTPEVFYENSFPEVHDNIEESIKERVSSHRILKPAFGWPLMIIAMIVAAAIAVGVGVGIWRHREHASHKSSTVINPPAPQSHNITPAAQFILNDTSLAALSLSNGDRHLFFQDNTGRIRRTIRTESNNQWSTSLYLNLSSNPKNYTPLVATAYEGLEAAGKGAEIGLLYVSESHILISGNSTTNLALLYYESPTGKPSALVQRIIPSSIEGQGQIKWVDISSQESQSLPDDFRNVPEPDQLSFTLYESDTNATFSTPFTSATNFTDSAIGALFYSPNVSLVNGGPIVINGYEIDGDSSNPSHFSGDFGSTINNQTGTPIRQSDTNQNYSSIRQSDIAIFDTYFAIWINGTQPIPIIAGDGQLPGTPNNSFPFTRLASVTFQSMTYLYHQINGTTFAEEQWDSSELAWIASEYITVSNP
ncbi:MAG: hypothetical protein ASARMPREDX12_002178 [Alectoria sarmentosa]|nr:MAG: hypothetical protein ASARMPREDX12_002178 [Alectoria sarmentosa]